MLALVPLLVLQLLLCLLLGYLLAILAAALRDMVQVVGFLLSVGIYLSPILFPLSLFPEAWRWVLWLNPMTALVLGYQQVLLQGVAACQRVVVGLLWLCGLALALNVVVGAQPRPTGGLAMSAGRPEAWAAPADTVLQSAGPGQGIQALPLAARAPEGAAHGPGHAPQPLGAARCVV